MAPVTPVQSCETLPQRDGLYSSKPLRVAAVLFTHQLGEENAMWFSRVKTLVDELVIFIDPEKATAETRARASQVASRLFEIPRDGISKAQAEVVDQCEKTRDILRAQFRELRPEMVEKCESEWVLRLDSDEELSPEWNDRRWRQLLETEEFTHFYLPRRWMINSNEFINCEPWWPDFSLRLFRKDCAIGFPTKVHEPLRISGRGGYCRHLSIHHHVLRLLSRADREEKVRNYEFLWPGEGLGHYYLFEDYTAPVTATPPTCFDPSTELLRMGRVADSEDIQQVTLSVSGFPPVVTPRETFWLPVMLTNNSRHTLCCGLPYPVNLAYHWIEADSRTWVVFDGNRTRLVPGIPSKTTSTVNMFVRAPAQQGRFILQVTLVQEGGRWFEVERPDIVQETKILVQANKTGRSPGR